MVGEVQVENLKAVMDASSFRFLLDLQLTYATTSQLWLDNQSGMTGLSSLMARVTSAISGLSNAFLGQTPSQARLNAMASYDQSNELFKVCRSINLPLSDCSDITPTCRNIRPS
jgi:cyclopropane-fatty-acyl-phospholipid synthase